MFLRTMMAMRKAMRVRPAMMSTRLILLMIFLFWRLMMISKAERMDSSNLRSFSSAAAWWCISLLRTLSTMVG